MLLSLVIRITLLTSLATWCLPHPITEQYPTSQPTANFVAPTIPEEFIGEGFTASPSARPTEYAFRPANGDGSDETFEKEIAEENRTAITTSSYIFITFVVLIVVVLFAYISKR